MKGLVLYGAKCDLGVWSKVYEGLAGLALEYAAYPHEMLGRAESVDDIAAWVHAEYSHASFDTIIGHSMGGQIALKLSALPDMRPRKLILIESNPVPSGGFFRNLMTAENTLLYGGMVEEMLRREAPFYREALLRSLREDFDLTGYIRDFPGRIYAIYGDRDRREDEARISELNLPQDVFCRLDIRFIRGACHLPMIENPEELSGVLREILTENA